MINQLKKVIKTPFFLMVLLILLTVSFFYSCKEKKTADSSTEEALAKQGTITKITQADDIQFAFDLTNITNYKKMLTQMKLSHPENIKSASHGLLLTLINVKTGELMGGAKVSLTFEFLNTSNNQNQPQKLNLETNALSGKGMHHYGTILRLASSNAVNGMQITAKAIINSVEYIGKIEF